MASDTRLRTLSLFSGIGGIDLALQPWCRTVCYCEIDPYAAGVLTKQMATGALDVAPVWDDVTTFGESELAQVGPIDCIVGGFPCTDISCAGKEAGITGEQSGLFFEIIRIVRMVRPRIIFLENVPAILTRGLDTVLRELAESGYDARWRCLSAAEVGAPHCRDRWWCLAYPESNRLQHGQRDYSSNNITKRQSLPRWRRDLAFDGLCGSISTPSNKTKQITSKLCRDVDGVPHTMDRLKCLGNAVVPAQARKAFELLIEASG